MRGVIGLSRDAGVGVDIATIDMELERKGSLPCIVLQDELDRGGYGRPRVEEEDGRSPRDGGVIPSSAYSQSICTRCPES